MNFLSSFEKSVYKTFQDDDKITLESLLEFVKQHVEELTLEENRPILVKILQHADKCLIYDASQVTKVLKFMSDLIIVNSSLDTELSAALKIVYQFLHILNEKPGPIEFETLAEQLSNLLASDTGRNVQILSCLKICLRKLESPASKMLQQLWGQQSEESVKILITVQLFDELSDCVPDLQIGNSSWSQILQRMLQSEAREERKTAYFLLKKHMQKNNAMPTTFWNSYINIMESLEENQAHLIIPALEKLPTMEATNNGLSMWLNILYIKILQQRSLPVIRWTLEYLLDNYDVASLSNNVLPYFLLATNNTKHFDKTADCFRIYIFIKFLKRRQPKDTSTENFLKEFVQIDWKPVPLLVWLHSIISLETFRYLDLSSCSGHILLLASSIRCFQNKEIRTECIKSFNLAFQYYMNDICIREFLLLTETLYNVDKDRFENCNAIFQKMVRCQEKKISVVFSERCCQIIKNAVGYSFSLSKQEDFFTTANTNAFMCILFMKCIDEIKNLPLLHDYLGAIYNLNLPSLKESSNMKEIILEFDEKLSKDNSAYEKAVIAEFAMTFFVACVPNISYFRESNQMQQLKDLLKTGSPRILSGLVRLIVAPKKNNDSLEDLESVIYEIFETYFTVCKDTDQYTRVPCVIKLMNCLNALNPQRSAKFAAKILSYYNFSVRRGVLDSKVKLDVDVLVKGILRYHLPLGDERIELQYTSPCTNEIIYFVNYIINRNCRETSLAVVDKLLQHNETMHLKKPRYYEFSGEHLQHINIAYSVGTILRWTDEHVSRKYVSKLLKILLYQNNQLNVNVMYECMTGLCILDFEQLLSTLMNIEKLTQHQHVSLISVIHVFCLGKQHKISEKQFDQLCQQILLPLTMGAKFQTRLCAMLVIYNVLVKLFPKSNPTYKKSIEIAIGGLSKIEEYLQNDPHMVVPKLLKCGENIFSNILYVNNTPINMPLTIPDYVYPNELDEIRYRIQARKATATKIEKPNHSDDTEGNVQRKMNPSLDIIDVLPCLMTTETDQQMYVVATLVEKIPNLGGIARSCEVLGIKNYVIKNKLLIDRHEFKSLSLTAEKTLNVIEVKVENLMDFLVEKQHEGFQIVGAEQTAKSKNFTNFEFPEKCILLLGHEKEGISPEFLPILDHAVEIPQHGQVRSLNVHVTGALFMWEYCKQHINNLTKETLLS